jgi:hypothetical protein
MKRSKKQEIIGQQTIFQGFGIKPEVTAEPPAEAVAAHSHQQADLEADPNYDRRK